MKCTMNIEFKSTRNLVVKKKKEHIVKDIALLGDGIMFSSHFENGRKHKMACFTMALLGLTRKTMKQDFSIAKFRSSSSRRNNLPGNQTC